MKFITLAFCMYILSSLYSPFLYDNRSADLNNSRSHSDLSVMTIGQDHRQAKCKYLLCAYIGRKK